MVQIEQVYKMIKDGDMESLRLLLINKFNPNQPVSSYESLLECSLDYEQYDIAKLLIEFGAALPTDVMVDAARGDRNMFEYLLSKGADLNAINHVGHSALSRALAFENMQGAYTLIDLGIDLSAIGGGALIHCAYEGKIEFLKNLINLGVDINFYSEDNIFTSGATPLIAAVIGKQFETVKYLINKGADTSLVCREGCRAYNYARIQDTSEIASYIKLFEPHEYHDINKRTEELIDGGVPLEVIEVLKINNKRLEYESENYSNYLVLGDLSDVVYFEYHDFKLYNLLLEVDNFEAFGMITWCPHINLFVSVDIEHEWIYLLHDMTWESFLNNPGLYIDRIIDGYYDCEEIEEEAMI
ncbi:ankyrin repeat domain-containing protein [Paenibacillus sp. NPDC058174]|uniref:ankyrin repeat domain-containing protein n=1 Tax=Paenibacillus sp. NPDC058174 TaxID=3346366 RepID=UPI0036DCE383